MTDDIGCIPENQRLVGVDYIANLTGLSKPTIWRHCDAGLIPNSVKIGRNVRWRLRTGNPRTGILDWLEAGCGPVEK
ncbi:MAG: putative DNA-binding transcriptional regulator AlpA [Planctomycetaceae bacterium]